MKHYKVEARCGHVGKNNYIIKNFYIRAENGKEAAYKTRKMPRVKHHHKYAIVNVAEISYDEYLNGLNEVSNDTYFLAHNSSEQRAICDFLDGEIIKENRDECFIKPTHAKRRIINDLLIKDWKSGRDYLYE